MVPEIHLLAQLTLGALAAAEIILCCFRKWKWAAALLLRTAIGWGLVFLFDTFCTKSGIRFGQNLFTGATVGLLGLPGAGLLLMLRRLFVL